MAPVKHFLDTSVARSWLLGIRAQQHYFNAEFGQDICYRSKFVLMEFTRSYIRPIIEFCFVLALPNIESVADAIAYWSNRFKGSELKAALQMISDVLQAQALDLANPRDKEQSLRELAAYIELILIKMEYKFRDTGIDSARCARVNVMLDIDPDQPDESLRQFIEAFDNVTDHRCNCKIGDLVQRRYRNEITHYLEKADSIKRNKETKGFLDIAEKLKAIMEGDNTAGSCKICEAIGDAIIALDTPRQMCLEHTDFSFDLLCELINQPHRRHPSAAQLLKRTDAD